MTSAAFIVPGRLDTLTGGSIYDRRIVDALRAAGWTIDVHELSGDFPQPSPDAMAHARRVFASLADGTTAVVDGLALGAMPDIVEHEARRLRIVALIHLPLALEVGRDPVLAQQLERSERRTLAAVDRVVVTGTSTIDLLRAYGVTRERIVVVEPGTERAPIAVGGDGRTIRMLSVATLSPGKGHLLLVGALATINRADWTLTCVGSTTRYPETVARVRASIRACGLEDRIVLAGELSGADLEAQYAQSDLFVLATLRETYGMAVAEALAHGVPVVATRTGSIADLVGEEAGLIVPCGDQAALADALARITSDAALRTRLGAGARRVREHLQGWDVAAAKMATVLDRVPAHG
jgi:glycosyltransferase involved in cell wall biosynthesis